MKEVDFLNEIEKNNNCDFYKEEYLKAKEYFKINNIYGARLKKYYLDFAIYQVNGKLLDNLLESLLIKGVTYKRLCLRYGDIEGEKRWKSYKEKQAITNTKEYKMIKHGMSSDEVDSYNKSRAVTKENCINRHGVEHGLDIWNNYCKRQAYAGCALEYFVEKYGDIEGNERWKSINLKKAQTENNFIERYGLVDGKVRYETYITTLQRKRNCGSQISQELFWVLYDYLTPEEQEKCYFYEHKGEFSKYCEYTNTFRFFDFVISSLKYCIEFNGNIFHANPKLYKSDDRPNPFNQNLTSADIWEHDRKKNKNLTNIGFIVDVVWENEVDIDAIIKRIEDVREMRKLDN